MHKVVQIHMEGYLDGNLLPAARREVESHLRACTSCSLEIEEARQTKQWMQLLVAEPNVAPAPGFYARVCARVEAEQERSVSFWPSLLPVFSRQLGLAMAMLLVLLTSFVLTLERTERKAPPASAAAMIMDAPVIQTETPALTADEHSNRERVMEAIVAPPSGVEGD